MGLIQTLCARFSRSRSPEGEPSLGDILAEALRAAQHNPPAAAPKPGADAVHPLFAPLSIATIPDDRSFLHLALAKAFAAEMGAHGYDAPEVWDYLRFLPGDALDDLTTRAGWASLSAHATNGALILDLGGALGGTDGMAVAVLH